ncbi:MAG TPA: hypothetical protein VF469_34160 [Kofleriaceae bacterium]
MKPLLVFSGAMLCAAMIAACVSGDPTETRDEQSLTASGDTEVMQTSTEPLAAQLDGNTLFEITPQACFIEGFCHDARAGFHPAYCIHTGPCGSGQALELAHTFCINHCSNNTNCAISNIVPLPACP